MKCIGQENDEEFDHKFVALSEGVEKMLSFFHLCIQIQLYAKTKIMKQ